MRKISLGRTHPHGHLRPMLNNEFVFQIGFLDQVRSPQCVLCGIEDGERHNNLTTSIIGMPMPILRGKYV